MPRSPRRARAGTAFAVLVILTALGPGDPEAGRAEGPRPTSRSGRHCLVALGSIRDYSVAGARYDVVIVSPERPLGAALDRARRAHPGAMILGYLNTMDVFDQAARGEKALRGHEDWFLHDEAGARVRVRVERYAGGRARYGMNVGRQGYQDYLADLAITILRAGYDGLHLDNVETDSSYTPRQVGRFISALPVELSHDTWPEAERSMLARIKRRLVEAGFADRPVIINQIRSGEPEVSRMYLREVDGANCEGWLRRDRPHDGRFGWKAKVDQAAEVGRDGKRLNLLNLADSMSPDEAQYLYASYLLALEGDAMTFFYGRQYRPDQTRWYDLYDVDIGRPAGPMSADGGVYTRRFAAGFVAVNPFDQPAAISPPEGLVDPTFEPAVRVEMRPKSAVILMRPASMPARTSLEAESAAPSGAAGVVDRPDASGGHAVRFSRPGETLDLPIALPKGRYRIVVDGFAGGRQADAFFVKVAGVARRLYFAPGQRPYLDVDLGGKESSIRIEAAEAGVMIDRVVLIALPVAGR